jgi:hypothetical protein
MTSQDLQALSALLVCMSLGSYKQQLLPTAEGLHAAGMYVLLAFLHKNTYTTEMKGLDNELMNAQEYFHMHTIIQFLLQIKKTKFTEARDDMKSLSDYPLYVAKCRTARSTRTCTYACFHTLFHALTMISKFSDTFAQACNILHAHPDFYFKAQ